MHGARESRAVQQMVSQCIYWRVRVRLPSQLEEYMDTSTPSHPTSTIVRQPTSVRLVIFFPVTLTRGSLRLQGPRSSVQARAQPSKHCPESKLA